MKKKKYPYLGLCVQCNPPTEIQGHLEYKGIQVHSRIDCPPGMIYMINENEIMKKVKKAIKKEKVRLNELGGNSPK